VAEPRRCVIGQRGHDDGALRGLGLLLVVLALTLVAAPPANAAPVVTPDPPAAGVDPTPVPVLMDADIVRMLRSDDEGDEPDDEDGENDEGDDDEGDEDDPNPDEMARAGRRRARLLSPAANATVRTRRPPLLRWMPVQRARYYNVQLFRGDRKVLSAWPARPRYQIKKRWTLRGTPQRLRRGRYRWYVWPGFGARPKARYGDLLGPRTFTVVGR
jgi:hypothetical protein